MKLVRLWRYELFFEHFLDQFAHFVVLAGDELLLELYGCEELGIIEFRGFEVALRILVLPFVAGIAAVADSTDVFKSELAFLLFFLHLYSLGVRIVGKAHFFHHFG